MLKMAHELKCFAQESHYFNAHMIKLSHHGNLEEKINVFNFFFFLLVL